MFEKYTPDAKRVIFFARYEASRLGATAIEVEHLKLGLGRVDRRLVRQLQDLPPQGPKQSWWKSLMQTRVSTSVALHLSTECKRILADTKPDQADKITPKTLLEAVLRERRAS
jgi:ATP-dependent Clp protease ATP-binding subunit ClpC